MTRHRTHRADGNQSEIIDALRQTGHQVVLLSQVGGGVPDVLVARGKRMLLMEIKQDGGELTPEQVIWHKENDGFVVAVVHNASEAIEAMNRTMNPGATSKQAASGAIRQYDHGGNVRNRG